MNTIIELLQAIFDIIKNLLIRAYEYFLDLSIIDKAIVLTILPGFLTITRPVCRYYFFPDYKYVNNPLAVEMIGIIAVMLATIYFRHFYSLILLIIRILVNSLYGIIFLYMHLSDGIIKTEYQLTPWFYLNFIVPLVFIGLSLLSYFIDSENS